MNCYYNISYIKGVVSKKLFNYSLIFKINNNMEREIFNRYIFEYPYFGVWKNYLINFKSNNFLHVKDTAYFIITFNTLLGLIEFYKFSEATITNEGRGLLYYINISGNLVLSKFFTKFINFYEKKKVYRKRSTILLKSLKVISHYRLKSLRSQHSVIFFNFFFVIALNLRILYNKLVNYNNNY